MAVCHRPEDSLANIIELTLTDRRSLHFLCVLSSARRKWLIDWTSSPEDQLTLDILSFECFLFGNDWNHIEVALIGVRISASQPPHPVSHRYDWLNTLNSIWRQYSTQIRDHFILLSIYSMDVSPEASNVNAKFNEFFFTSSLSKSLFVPHICYSVVFEYASIHVVIALWYPMSSDSSMLGTFNFFSASSTTA